ncbi:MAG TPA: AAA family ATPase, partial [Baekduia sp.]|nr:AAA family ATPase [Baekduia sp.]
MTDPVTAPVSSVEAFLSDAIAAAAAVARLHAETPFHGRLSPASVGLEGDSDTWAYRAPEQTGRLQRQVDSRTDLYALGVILFARLTGRLPFDAVDPLEWVHRHLAVPPRAPRSIDPTIPEMVERVVLRLLAKDPDDRYQTAAALRDDLQRCLRDWHRHGDISLFAPGERDRGARVAITRRLYGRESERRRLLAAFEEVAEQRGPRMTLITGRPGIGKTALARDLEAPVAAAGGVMASAKFDEARGGAAYTPIVQAFRDLVALILAGSEAHLTSWRERLQTALGESARVLTDVLGELELVLGRPPAVPALPPAETHRRFAGVFARFVGAFATPAHPLVLVLDDLQWADTGSLRLLGDLLDDQALRSLLVIGTCRTAETLDPGPLAPTLDALRARGAPLKTIDLGPLGEAALTGIVAEALDMEPEGCASLQRVLEERSAGNPLFFTELLVELGRIELLRYQAGAQTWTWDIEQIRGHRFSGTVAELLAQRLDRCDARIADIVTIAACLADSFDTEVLAEASGRSRDDVKRALDAAVAEGLLLRSRAGYAFSHDRVREAAYARIPAEERAARHLELGRALLRGTPARALPEAVHRIVEQLNLGRTLIDDPAERLEVARLNRLAAARARASAAFAAASECCRAGLQLLGPDGWVGDHDLAFALACERAECELFAGDVVEVERLLDMAAATARTPLEHTRWRRIAIDVYTGAARLPAALECAAEVARMHGLQFPLHPSEEEADAAERAMRERLGDRSPASLLDLPRAHDPELDAALELLAGVLPSASHADVHLHRLLACQIIDLTLQHGLFAASTWGMAGYGLELALAGHPDEGFEMAAAALEIVDRHGFRQYRTPVCDLLAMVALPWARSPQTGIEYARQGIRSGMENGHIFGLMLGCLLLSLGRLFAGDSLAEVEDEIDEALGTVRPEPFRAFELDLLLERQVVRALRGTTHDVATMTGHDFDEQAFAESVGELLFPLVEPFFVMFRLHVGVFGGDFVAALAASDQLETWSQAIRGLTVQADASFLGGLAIAGSTESVRSGRLDQLRANAQRLRGWARTCPETFEHRAQLIEGELARAEGRPAEALERFVQAAALACATGVLHVEALAHESAARACAERGLDAGAREHLREAVACYARWGAAAKVAQLVERDPGVAPAPPDLREGLDALAVAKASQAISAEVDPQRLQERLMETVVVHAGASGGALLLPRHGRFLLAAQAQQSPGGVAVTLHDPPREPLAEGIPESVVRYVERTCRPLVLGDAKRSGFGGDPGVAGRPVRSVLCVPIVAQGELRGLLYLENDLVSDAFGEERLHLLDALATQSAISLENAALYGQLRHEIAERERAAEELRHAQKMQAVGRLAGGIAHDFNNLLTGIGLCTVLALSRTPDDDPLRDDLQNIQRAAQRGEALTQQLMAFSRKQALAPQVLEPRDVIGELEPLLRRLLGDGIELIVEVPHDCAVHVDRGQLEQVVVNLVVNARDAMPDGGRLIIHGKRTRLDAAPAAELGVAPGAYVRLTVADTGTGMDEETRRRIFEPFYTTKPIGRGTGLGLSTVYGVIVASGGHIGVRSAPGEGAEFVIHVPHEAAAVLAAPTETRDNGIPGGTETILLVEADELVRTLVGEALERLGYTVLQAANGEEASRLHAHHEGPVDLLIADVLTPRLGGRDLARRLRADSPDLAVVFTSGYPEDLPVPDVAATAATSFVHKPFSPETLGHKVREALERRPAAARTAPR